ncbi:MAG: PTS IIA-like nitrogen regulatory protein PtsN [Lysobacterales bacterium]
MQLVDLLSRSRVQGGLALPSKKRLLEHLARLLAEDEDAELVRLIFEGLVSREKMGSTGLGMGIAIPHGRIAADIQPVAAFVRLRDALAYDAADGEPVDLVLALIVPEHFTDQHLQLLAQVAEMFDQAPLLAQLRAAPDDEALYRLLAEWRPAKARA